MEDFEINIEDIAGKPKTGTTHTINVVPLAKELLEKAGEDVAARANALDDVCKMLANESNHILRGEYVRQVAKLYGYTSPKIEKIIKDIIAERNMQDTDPSSPLPKWVDPDKLYADGFVQLFKQERTSMPGIYFEGEESRIRRLTNFTIKPVIHIQDRENNRRIIELSNGTKTALVEMPSRAFVAKDMFETSLIERGNFITLSGFEKNQFKRVIAWLSESMPMCWEIKNLGWQPESFFAFSNRIWHKGNLLEYNSLGTVTIDDTQFISLANSSINSDTRQIDNPYENDRFLEYCESPMDFNEWAQLFTDVYGTDKAINGLTYVFVTLFKDIITQTTKCPLLFCYGAKGSGKSEFAESLLHLFFSGKNSEGNLMSGLNLNPGQITPFAFFNFQERFANCPGLYNEFDENRIEDWVFGTMKSFYDGEGRVVGDGSTGKARKTKVQKTKGTMIVVGQYLSTGDDGSVLSRSITCQFDLSRMQALSKEIRDKHSQLKEAEKNGLSSIIVELLNLRAHVTKEFKKIYFAEYEKLRERLLKSGIRPETRLLRNYSLIPAIFKLAEGHVQMPIKYTEVFDFAVLSVAEHFKLLKETNALAKFWKVIEGMFDRKLINWDNVGHKAIETEFTIRYKSSGIQVKSEGEIVNKKIKACNVLTLRFNAVYQIFAKEWRGMNGGKCPDESTLLKYLQDQPYYIGLVAKHFFANKNTSGFAFDYDILSEEINLEHDLVDRTEVLPF
jgi:DNA primase